MKKSRKLDIILSETFEKLNEFEKFGDNVNLKTREYLRSRNFIYPIKAKISSEKRLHYKFTLQGDKIYSNLKKILFSSKISKDNL